MYLADKKNNENSKKILCFNMLNLKKCNYGNKCMYAHNLNEQKIESIRHKVYTIIKSADNLNNIDLLNDSKLYEAMLQLTKVCSLCSKGLCPGGYNCRNGSVNIKSRICYEDLVYGNCKKYNCQSVHLTEKGLISYNKQKYKDKYQDTDSDLSFDEYNNDNNENETEEINNDEIDSNKKSKFYKYTKKNINLNDKNNKIKKELDNIKGILLTDKFILTHFGKPINNENISSDSDNEEDIEKMIKYLNDNNNESDDESIFLV